MQTCAAPLGDENLVCVHCHRNGSIFRPFGKSAIIRTILVAGSSLVRRAMAHVAFFISPHGFGHAARASAVMSALHVQNPLIHCDIFSSVPRWFFADSLTGPFTYHSALVDVGLAQRSSLEEDIPLTIWRLDEFFHSFAIRVAELAKQVKRAGVRVVVCDIAPLGIAVAQAAGVSSVLVENFTWDWIYRPYARQEAGLRLFRSVLRSLFRKADIHIQTQPVCEPGSVDLVTCPVSRKPRTHRQGIRQRLGIPRRAAAVLITMGGIPERHEFLEQLTAHAPIIFVVPGVAESGKKQDNVILLPHRSEFYHPDLVNACDVVIGKSGYSTVAEVFHAGVPFGYVSRPRFPESAVMARFIQAHMRGVEISGARFESARWLADLPALLASGRHAPTRRNGADQIAQFLLSKIDLR